MDLGGNTECIDSYIILIADITGLNCTLMLRTERANILLYYYYYLMKKPFGLDELIISRIGKYTSSGFSTYMRETKAQSKYTRHDVLMK